MFAFSVSQLGTVFHAGIAGLLSVVGWFGLLAAVVFTAHDVAASLETSFHGPGDRTSSALTISPLLSFAGPLGVVPVHRATMKNNRLS